MISVNPAFLADVNRGFKARFARGIQRAKPTWRRLAMEVESQNASDVYPILGSIGTLREWIGNRIADELKVQDLAISNRHYEKTMRVNRDRFEDDQFSIYGTEAEMLGDAAERHPDKLIWELLARADSTLGYDGQYFIDTDHPMGTGTKSNKSTAVLNAANYALARASLAGTTDDSGETLDLTASLLIVGPANESMALQILNQEFISDDVGGNAVTVSNKWKGSASLVVTPRITGNNWYLVDDTKPIKPLIMQFRKRPELVPKTSIKDDNVFLRNEFLWGVDYRGGAGLALWQLIHGAIVP